MLDKVCMCTRRGQGGDGDVYARVLVPVAVPTVCALQATVDLRMGRLEEAHQSAALALERLESTCGLMNKDVARAHG